MEGGEFPEELKCPICMEIPEKEIFQCRNGHTICSDCVENLTLCPHCRVSFENPKIRNRGLETLLDMMKFECEHKAIGCTTKLSRKEITSHSINCVFGGTNIAFCKELGFTCGFSINTKALSKALKHLRDSHKFPIVRDALDITLRLDNFHNCNFTESSFWTPVVVQLKTPSKKLLIFLCTVNGSDETLSVMCLEIPSSNGVDTSNTNDRVEFCIQPLNLDENPEMLWNTKSFQAKHFSVAIANPTLRLSSQLLLQQYTQSNVIEIKCSIFNANSQQILPQKRNAETVTITNFSHGNFKPQTSSNNNTWQSVASRMIRAASLTSEESSSVQSADESSTSSQSQRRPKRVAPAAPVPEVACSVTAEPTSNIFTGADCSMCGKSPIENVRYVCLQCRDSSICKTCHDRGQGAHKYHVMCIIQNMDQDRAFNAIIQKIYSSVFSLFLGVGHVLPAADKYKPTVTTSHRVCSSCSNAKQFVCLVCKGLKGYCHECFGSVSHPTEHYFAEAETPHKLHTLLELMLFHNFMTARVLRSLLRTS